MPLLKCSGVWLAIINEVMQELIVNLSIHRYSPTLARQWVCGCLSQGPFLPPVGVQSWSAANTQGAWVPDPENLGWSVTTTTWRGETGSSYCWRPVFPLYIWLWVLCTFFLLSTSLPKQTVKIQVIHCEVKSSSGSYKKEKLLVNGQQIICSNTKTFIFEPLFWIGSK